VLVEVGVVAAAGGALGFLAAADALAYLARRAEGNIPYWIVLRADWRVAAFCLAITVLTVLAVGGGVALRASRPNVQGALKGSGPTASAARRQGRTRAALVVGELAVTLVLLAGAGLLLKTSLRLMRPSEGPDASRLVSADVALLDARWSDSSRVAAAVERLADRIARVPGVEAAGASRFEFLAGFGRDDQPITIEGRATPAGASPRFAFAVTPGYWAARGTRLVSGRLPTAADRAGTEPVVVVNASMAARLWPGASALGRRIKLGPAGSSRPWRTVVGVVADERPARGGDRVASGAWVPFAQWPGRPISLTARVGAAAQAPAVVRAIPDAAASILPEEPVENVRTIADGARAVARPTWLIAGALGGLAGFAVLVAALGVYGLVAQAVAQRTREIGVRVALGATSRDVLALLGRQSVRLAAAGVVLGLAGAGVATRVIRGLLFGTDPLDVQVMVAVTALLALVTIVAGYLPARRATRIDPVRALKTE
jgi:predicted permease